LFLDKLFKKHAKTAKQPTQTSRPSAKQRMINPTHIGDLGEYKIEVQLRQMPKEYRYLNDVLLTNSKSRTGYSQIDHVLVTPYAVFVIETKNRQGSIRGERKYSKWLVNGKPTLPNPLRQNHGHVKALQGLLKGFEGVKYVSMVSFTKRCTLNVEPELREIESDELILYDIKFSDYVERKIAFLKREGSNPSIATKRDITSQVQAPPWVIPLWDISDVPFALSLLGRNSKEFHSVLPKQWIRLGY
jgi:hypothetical protein